MAVGTYALITLAELQTYPGIPATLTAAEVASLEAMIDGVSATIDNYCQNFLVQRSVSEDYTWAEICGNNYRGQIPWSRLPEFSGGTPRKVELRQYPIVSVTSITDPAGNVITSANYWIDKAHGYLMRFGWQAPVDSNGYVTYWTIVYTAGRFANTAAVDNMVKLACKEQVAHIWSSPDESVQRTRVGDLEIASQYMSVKGNNYQLLDSVKSKLHSYKKLSV